MALGTGGGTTGGACGANHQQAATAATTRRTGWPTSTPKATGKTPSRIARCADRVSRLPGAARYHARTRAPRSSAVHTTIAAVKGRIVNGLTSHTSGGGFRNGDQ